jgi:hypothetical protein
MEFKSCELELSVTVKAEAGGGLRFWVVEASGRLANEAVSKVKLNFAAITGDSSAGGGRAGGRRRRGPVYGR